MIPGLGRAPAPASRKVVPCFHCPDVITQHDPMGIVLVDGEPRAMHVECGTWYPEGVRIGLA